MRVLVTGSAGLIGSEAVEYFDEIGMEVVGVDNNMRADFFGPRGDTTWNRDRLLARCERYSHHDLDIRDRAAVDQLVAHVRPDLVVHAAAQPSHDLAASRPFDDFDVNAGGTLALLEACRQHVPDAVFVFVSTNKVYGDNPNRLPIVELDTRYDFAPDADVAGLTSEGITEELSMDGATHSVFGASKVAADVMVQEYGKYFGLRTGVFRGGCLTGPHHSGVELHGFLSYLVAQAVDEGPYTMIGYKGKQVRDQIHSRDVISAFWAFAQDPRPGEAYNLGGGRANAASNLECVEMIAERCGRRPQLSFDDTPRVGDHICYYTDMSKFRADYPGWVQEHDLGRIVDEMVDAALARRA
ncbi:NAD-dependent epimerase/dehydratase family protein [Actinomarinicola tropica]|uniref:NAD-dependent epimerase/dehydratase family protein n=1 Tax=Actinomarinicola tropica TaxID=2789776 RepID=A0A5Q2RN44_9ACTN|nr:NAD-dependent epimerase/dehydratase family protein [Actinomarinicola tropica]QGG95826.1 NAD-dependent epimerase/dehydratase family protein [Actinomarinicola tropica]